MKILIIHNHYLYPGGEDIVVQSELKMLQEHGHEVILYERSNKEFYRSSFLSKMYFGMKDIFWSASVYRDIRKIIKKERPDVAHIHNMLFVISSSVYDACYDENLPVVQSLHNYRFLCPNGVFYRGDKICEDCIKNYKLSAVFHRCVRNSYIASIICSLGILAENRMKKILNEKVDFFVAPSQFCRNKFLETQFIPEKRIIIKPNFLIEDPLPAREDVGDYVLFVGALIPYKGINTLLKAWDKIADIPLKIIGGKPDFIKLSDDGRFNPNIEFLGTKSFEETLQYIRNSAFVVIPSECYETFSRVIIESFACGVPVIVSNIGALPERVIEGVSGVLFEAGNVNELAGKVSEFFGDKKKIKRMGLNAKEIFMHEYVPDKNYSLLMEVYYRAICGSKTEDRNVKENDRTKHKKRDLDYSSVARMETR